MPLDPQRVLSNVAPLGFVVGGFLVGAVVEAFVLTRIARALERRQHLVAARLIGAFGGALTLWTTALGARFTLDGYELSAQERALGDQAVGIVLLFAVSLVVVRIAERLVAIYLQRHREALPTASLLSTLTGIAIWTIATAFALQSLGIAITPLLGALGVGGLAVALALQPTLQNLFSGLQIIASRQIRIGDFVSLESGKDGSVVDITWRTTTIRDAAGHLIVVPNAALAQQSFTNYSLPEHDVSLGVPILIPHDADLENVERATLEVAREVLTACGEPLEGFEPYVRFSDWGDENLKLSAFLRAGESVDRSKLRSDFMKRLQARFRREGIGLPFPAKTAPPTPQPAEAKPAAG